MTLTEARRCIDKGVPDVWFIDADLLVEWDGTRKRLDRKLKEWQGFLTDFGAPRSMQFVRKPWLLPQECAVEAAEVVGPSGKLTKVTGHSEIADLPKPFAYLADKVASTRNERGRLLLKLLDRLWGEWESRFGGPDATTPPWWQSTYGTILWLHATSDPGRYHLHAEPLEEPADVGTVEFFDFDDAGLPVVSTCRPRPFTVALNQNVYRQERRWGDGSLPSRREPGACPACDRA